MNFKLDTLTNSLRVITVEVASLESVCLTLWIGVGSRYEHDKIAGISHFLEHMAFKGSRKYPTARLITQTLDALGADYNAATSREWTNFYIKIRADLVDKAFEVLADIVKHPLLDEAEMQKEKETIVQEIAMDEDIPMEKVGEVFSKLVFPNNPLGRDIAGSAKSVRALSKSNCLDFRNGYYGANNMVLTVSGGITSKAVGKLTKNYFGDIDQKNKDVQSSFEYKQKQPGIEVLNKKIDQAHFILGYPAYNRTHPDRFAESLLSTLLGRGMSSRLFTEVREKRGLAYAVTTTTARYIDTGLFAIYEGVSVDKVQEAIEITLDQIYGLASGKYAIDKAELTKAKEYNKGRTALALEDTANINDFFGEKALFHEELTTPEEVFAKIDAVTIDDVVRVATDLFVKDKLNLAVVGPFKNEEKFVKLLTNY